MFNQLITVDPKVMGGRPCIRDTRIPVSLVIKLLAKGLNNNQISDDYPEITEEDITACLEYAVWSVSESSLPVSG